MGYQSIVGQKGVYELKAVQFTNVSGAAFNIKDLTGDLIGPAYDEDALFVETAPTLMVRENGGYTYYYYLSDGAVDADGEYIPGWADVGGNPLPDEGVEIPAGTAFWFLEQSAESSTLTIPGAVLSDVSCKMDFKSGYTLAASPYPVSVAFSEIEFTGLTGPAYDEDANFVETAPTMMVRENGGYTYYYYLSDGAINAGGEYIPGWADVGGNPLDDYSAKVIETAGAFWIYIPESASPFSATFSL